MPLPNKIIMTLFYILPLSGVTYTFGKMLHRQLIEWKKKKGTDSRDTYEYVKLIAIFIMFVWGCCLCIFFIVSFWFSNVEIPKTLNIVCLILIIPYFMGMFVLYGLSRAVAAGSGSATGILKGLSDILAEKPSEPNKKIGKHNKASEPDGKKLGGLR